MDRVFDTIARCVTSLVSFSQAFYRLFAKHRRHTLCPGTEVGNTVSSSSEALGEAGGGD